MIKIDWNSKIGLYCHVKKGGHWVLVQVGFPLMLIKKSDSTLGILIGHDNKNVHISLKKFRGAIIRVTKKNVVFDE